MALYERVAGIIEAARGHVARTVNTAMAQAYWLIGREIVEIEQRGQDRAAYGEQIIENLAGRLSKRFGRGFSVRSLRRIRQFYLTYPDGSSLPAESGGGDKRPTPLAISDGAEIRPTALAESGTQSVDSRSEPDGHRGGLYETWDLRGAE